MTNTTISDETIQEWMDSSLTKIVLHRLNEISSILKEKVNSYTLSILYNQKSEQRENLRVEALKMLEVSNYLSGIICSYTEVKSFRTQYIEEEKETSKKEVENDVKH